MFRYKHITLICGHYGSGKTNVALNMAMDLKKQHGNTALADLDIVNPYFRTADSRQLLERLGIRLICSDYAASNVDLPSLPQDIYAITERKEMKTVIDVGGDDRGALALGRLRDAIKAEGDYDMFIVVNRYRPLTRDAEQTVDVIREIEQACGIAATGLINNSNLGESTTIQTVADSIKYAEETSSLSGLPVVMTTVDEKLFSECSETVPGLFSLKLQNKII